ncbi:Uncharacterized protein TPAR_02925, partial [Tolypocladium paradoxum]
HGGGQTRSWIRTKFNGGLDGATGLSNYDINSYENVICYNITLEGWMVPVESLRPRQPLKSKRGGGPGWQGWTAMGLLIHICSRHTELHSRTRRAQRANAGTVLAVTEDPLSPLTGVVANGKERHGRWRPCEADGTKPVLVLH